MPQHLPPFLPGETYHVYNHANGSDNIFREEDNYRFFVERYKKYMGEMVDTLAYCWMKNHFHLMVRVKEEEFFRNYFKTSKVFENLGGLGDEELGKNITKTVSQRFSNLFNSYTKAFNKRYDRMGSLFAPNVKRKQIENDVYYTSCIIYIHQNPALHGFINNALHWKQSSYWGILESNDPLVKMDKVLEWFGGKKMFEAAHERKLKHMSVFE